MQTKTLLLSAAFGLFATSSFALTFAEIDANADGQLDLPEFTAAYPDSGEIYFNLYDRNGDGFAAQSEVRAASDLLREGVTMAEIDLDKSGDFDRAEVEHAFSIGAQAALSKFDANADGNVTLNEVRASDDAEGESGAENSSRGQERSASARARVSVGASASTSGASSSARGSAEARSKIGLD